MRKTDTEGSDIGILIEEPAKQEYVELDSPTESKTREEMLVNTYFQLNIEIAQLELDIITINYEESKKYNSRNTYHFQEEIEWRTEALIKTKDAKEKRKLPLLQDSRLLYGRSTMEQSIDDPKYLREFEELLSGLKATKENLIRKIEELKQRRIQQEQYTQAEQQKKIAKELEESIDADKLHGICTGNMIILRDKMQALVENIANETSRFAFRRLKRDKSVIERSLKELEKLSNNLQSPDSQIRTESLKQLQSFSLEWRYEQNDKAIMSKTDFNSEFTSPISESVTPISEVKTVRMYLWYKDILKDLRRKLAEISSIHIYTKKDIQKMKSELDSILQRTERFTTNYPTEIK
ncbi:TPA: hypothetical protein DCQ85_03260 [Candidatus Magasanikbacteria bacterium]|nr:MAG: hypothetical protein A2488_01755 [Candidatus Magasanikbacteria bacterium RIFOXYC12_FULL_32_21b]OGH90730.1 MAG: hypothetical protein A2507_02360 [Candidatus Magasanikbacteria bacterium RIFOXYD12_FULL_33_17]HAO52462.1 hypothetical protein [Candidatus Magasanikbacteria bacterium]